jgi:hypothetical protein
MDTLEDIIRRNWQNYDDLVKTMATRLEDDCTTDCYIRDLVRGILTDFEIDGDSYGVPTLEDIVDSLCNRILTKEK